MFFSAPRVVLGGMLNYSCRTHPNFVYVIAFLLKGGKFPQSVLLSAAMLNTLNHVGSEVPKKTLPSAEMLNMLNVFCPMGPIYFFKGGSRFFGCVEFFLQKNSVALYVELFLQKAA